ncbi:MAG: Hsp20/alpha crystallin family protein, partial [Spirochaetaceae bacterium]|nr:Hsp20/alpha crystallin family protein [Spirochaetaceae bacterium]
GGHEQTAHSGSQSPRWYAYPPTNAYVTSDDSLVMEFALAGIDESSVSISFQGDFLVLDARLVSEKKPDEEPRYSRHGFRPRDLRRQKYLVPAEDYAQEKAKAVLKHGLLTVTVPAKDFPEGSGVKVEIVKEGN